jgi:hypothetical protein
MFSAIPLVDFPLHLSIEIVTEWLTMVDVARLDSAICVHGQRRRKDFMENVISAPITVFSGINDEDYILKSVESI